MKKFCKPRHFPDREKSLQNLIPLHENKKNIFSKFSLFNSFPFLLMEEKFGSNFKKNNWIITQPEVCGPNQIISAQMKFVQDDEVAQG